MTTNTESLKAAIEKTREMTLDYAIAVFDLVGGRLVNASWVVQRLEELKALPLDHSVITASAAAKDEPVAGEREAFDAWFKEYKGLKPESNTTLMDSAFDPWKAWQARAALSSAQQVRQEPVAWQARRSPHVEEECTWNWFDVSKTNYDDFKKRRGYEVRELFAAPVQQEAKPTVYECPDKECGWAHETHGLCSFCAKEMVAATPQQGGE